MNREADKYKATVSCCRNMPIDACIWNLGTLN
jgi:hypothetical protein